ncbi:MAG TPA: alpha/beta hydrolase [Gemmatirosa sp.]|nr:alpha/beta hydrolase [Gemmatirosa sp.]
MRTYYLPTGRLDVAYLADGPAGAPPVLLLHGFPDDATAWVPVMERLAAAGRRCIAPFVRGCGGTCFTADDAPRAGDFAALGNDALALVDALDLKDVTVVGQDWGSPTAEVVAMCRPERVRRLVKCNWYGVYSMHEMARAHGFAYAQLRTLWYVWMLNTPLGEMALRHDRAGFTRALWEEWSPSWEASARTAALDTVLPSFAGDDWARVVLAAYRSGTGPAESDPGDDALRARLRDPLPIRCPTRLVHGADDGVERSPLSAEARARWFPGGLEVAELAGVGHWPQREAPDAVAAAAALA